MANGKTIQTKQPAGALAKINFAEDANIGLEKMTAQDLAIPFLALIQKTSPQIEEIEGCKPGMIFNTVSSKLYKELIVLIIIMITFFSSTWDLSGEHHHCRAFN